jgi:hypothetical protein
MTKFFKVKLLCTSILLLSTATFADSRDHERTPADICIEAIRNHYDISVLRELGCIPKPTLQPYTCSWNLHIYSVGCDDSYQVNRNSPMSGEMYGYSSENAESRVIAITSAQSSTLPSGCMNVCEATNVQCN